MVPALSASEAKAADGLILLESDAAELVARLDTEDAECAICLAAVDAAEPLMLLPCGSATQTEAGHLFHASCLRTWLLKKAICPKCRRDVRPLIKRGMQPCVQPAVQPPADASLLAFLILPRELKFRMFLILVSFCSFCNLWVLYLVLCYVSFEGVV